MLAHRLGIEASWRSATDLAEVVEPAAERAGV
jgi:hypothetical protein